MATHWTASAVMFTTGQKTATVGTGDNIDSIFPNSALFVGGFDTPFEVIKAYDNGGVPTLELEKNWSGSTGERSCVIVPSASAAAAAGKAAQQLNSAIATLVNSASTSPSENSFAMRDSSGRLLTANASAANHAVAFGQLGDSAFLESYKEYGLGSSGVTITASENKVNGFYRSTDIGPANSAVINFGYNSVRRAQILGTISGIANGFYGRTQIADDSWSALVEFYHSGNVNFDEFGGAAGDDVFIGTVAQNTSVANFRKDTSFVSLPSSITIAPSITFTVIDELGNVLASGVTPSLNGRTSKSLLILQVTGLSGASAGATVTLRLEQSSLKAIRVNF